MDDPVDKAEWVRRRAYEIWQQEGEGHGRHHDHWLEAERDYEARAGAASGEDSPPAEPPGTAAEAARTSGDLQTDSVETPPPATGRPSEAPPGDASVAADLAKADRELSGKDEPAATNGRGLLS